MLGENSGLLDDYLAGILNAVSETTNPLDTVTESEGAIVKLLRILEHIKDGAEDEAQKHPFYPTVKAYIDAHPFPRDNLYFEMYCVGLLPAYLAFAVKEYMSGCNDRFQERLKAHDVSPDALLSSGAGITADDFGVPTKSADFVG